MSDQPIQRVIDHLKKYPLVPVFYHKNPEVCLHVVDACYQAGVRVFEFTNRGGHALENYGIVRQHIAVNYPDLVLGIGTIFTYSAAKDFLSVGCDFVVSPALIPEMKQIQIDDQTLWVPGCATLSELAHARALGAKLIKAFPAKLLTVEFISAALSVMPELKLMPTGGIEPTKETLAAWMRAGAMCVGIGSQLLDKKLIEGANWKGLQTRLQDAVEILQKSKNQ